jgi:glycosyltransferase EpsE
MIKNNPKISIVMSTYNGSKFIKDSIVSVINQSYKDFEFIIINDCSTDNVEKIIKEFLSKDDRIIYIKNEKNLKLTASLNK